MTSTPLPAAGTTHPTDENPTRTIPFGHRLAAGALVLGAGGNTAQAVLGQFNGGRPDSVEEQIAFADAHTAQMVAWVLSGTLAVPLMFIGFLAAARLLRPRARRTAAVATGLLALGMWGFIGIQVALTVQLAAMLDGDGEAAAIWMDGLDSIPLLGVVFGIPFMAGAFFGLVTLSIALLVTGAVPRWIGACWLAFILLDFSVGGVGPVNPHWLYFAGAVGIALHLGRDGGRVWQNV